MRFLLPLHNLVELWQPKLLVALVASAVVAVVKYVAGVLGKLLHVEPVLAVGVLLLVVFDFFAGYRAARRRGEASSWQAIRKTYDKVVTYILSLLAVAVFANMFVGRSVFGEIASLLLDGTFFFFAVTEVVSIRGNLTGDKEGAKRWLARLWKMARTRDFSGVAEEQEEQK